MSGMLNRILVLDLTHEEIEDKSLETKILKAFIGGSSLAAKLFLDCNGHEIRKAWKLGGYQADFQPPSFTASRLPSQKQ